MFKLIQFPRFGMILHIPFVGTLHIVGRKEDALLDHAVFLSRNGRVITRLRGRDGFTKWVWYTEDRTFHHHP